MSGRQSVFDSPDSGAGDLPVEHVTNILGLALTDDEFLAVVEGDKPALTGDHAHFPNLLNVHQGVSMNTTKSAILQSLFNRLSGSE